MVLVQVRADTVVEVWKATGQEEELNKVTRLGYRAIQSACWYLNYISTGADWKKYYMCDPQAFNGKYVKHQVTLTHTMFESEFKSFITVIIP